MAKTTKPFATTSFITLPT